MTDRPSNASPGAFSGDKTLKLRAAPTIGRKVLPYVTLVILLTLSVMAWQYFENQSAQRKRRNFNEYVESMSKAIVDRLLKYEMIMKGGAGLFSAALEVTREEWRNYVSYHSLEDFPGIRSLGIARYVRHADLRQHYQEAAAIGITDYAISPSGDREEYCPLIFAEPVDEGRRSVVGFDLLVEPARRKALERAVASGTSAMSENISLLRDEDRRLVSGFLLCLPIYNTVKTLHNVNDRKTALWGYVVSAFHMEELIRGVFADNVHRIEFEIFDGQETRPAKLMFDSHQSSEECADSMFTMNKVLELYGRQWTLVFHSTKAFEAISTDRLPKTLFAGLLIISLLIFLFLKMLEGTGERALELAQELTHELEEERAWLNTVIDTAMDAIIVLDQNGLILVWNASAVRLFGYAVEETIGRDFNRLLPPLRFQEAAAKGFQSFKETGVASIIGVNNDIYAVHKDGHAIPVEITVAPRRGYVQDGVVAVVRDVTERKKTQEQIVAERQRLYHVLEALPAFVALIRKDHTVAYVNRQFREQFGEPAGRTWHEAIFGKKERCDSCRTLEVFDSGAPVFWEMHGANGKIYQMHDYPYTDSSGDFLVLQFGLDITKQKQAETERIARQAAEAASRQKSQFLSNMSHEIRTPMNAILGFAQILQFDKSLSPKQLEQIRSINSSGKHLLALINDILDMSKIEAGMSAIRPVVFCFHDLIDDLSMMFRSRAEARKLQFVVECDENIPDHVRADESKVRQILINLLGNAVKFTSSGGVAMRVHVSSGDDEELRILVEVEDSGPGISESDLAKIFVPFGQGESGVNAGGTGLGLAISRRLAEMMGGDIRVDTRLGRGSCFRLELPLELAEASGKIEASPQRRVIGLAHDSGSFRILVVDDQKPNRELLFDLLQPFGFELREAENGAVALAIFEEWSPHAVLMDMRMPVMDGYEATQRIKASEKGHNTHVLAVTASAFKDSEELLFSLGVSAYIRKPFRPEELWEALGECLGLRYIYADEEPSSVVDALSGRLPVVDHERVAVLPAESLKAMRQAVEEGDMTRLLELIDQIEPQEPVVARALHALADRYDYAQLSSLLDDGGKSDS